MNKSRGASGATRIPYSGTAVAYYNSTRQRATKDTQLSSRLCQANLPPIRIALRAIHYNASGQPSAFARLWRLPAAGRGAATG